MVASDLKIIQQLYFREAECVLVFDPNAQLKGNCPSPLKLISNNNELAQVLNEGGAQSYIIFNLSKNKNDFDFKHGSINNIVHFNLPSNTNSDIKHHFVNNTNGSMRWIFPSTNRSAVFLSLYNNTGWKAKVYKGIVKLCTLVGGESMFSNGYFTFEKQTSSLYDFLPNKYHDEYAIFTGTAGENRKAIVAIAAHKYVSSFIKIPLTKKAKSLVGNELQQLNYIKKLDLVKMSIPKSKGTASHLELTNIKPVDPLNQSSLTDQHLIGISELYNKTTRQINPQTTNAWNEIQSNLRLLNDDFEIKNDLSKQKIGAIVNQLNHLVDWIGGHHSISVGLAHGDFTPWNMYLTNDKIHVYDWEMSTTDMPLLFDVFHFVFQNEILINQNQFDTIRMQLQKIRKHEIVSSLVSKHAVDWSLHYAFYLVYISSYYLPLYLKQQDLHMQAHWLVDVWLEALELFSYPQVEQVV